MNTIKKKTNISFQTGNMLLIRAYRVWNKRNDISAKLLPSLEGSYIVHNEFSTNGNLAGYLKSERIRGVFNIQDVYKFEIKQKNIRIKISEVKITNKSVRYNSSNKSRIYTWKINKYTYIN